MTMRAAVVDPQTGAVMNVIVANPQKDSVPGHLLVAIPDGVAVDRRWMWSAGLGFYPGPELQAEIDAAAAEIESEGLRFDD